MVLRAESGMTTRMQTSAIGGDAEPSPDSGPILDVRGLSTRFRTPTGWLDACSDVDLVLRRGQVLGVVGESGSGKSTLGLSIMRLVPHGGVTKAERLVLDGVELLGLSERGMCGIRGRLIGMVFQSASNAMDPCYTVGWQLVESIRLNVKCRRSDARERARSLLDKVGLDRSIMKVFPHELSGGMRQRAGIALALAGGPRVVIADEPTTTLDVTVQATILRMLRDLCRGSGVALMLISHDLAVVANMADVLLVMYGGRVVEVGTASNVISNPKHPYTKSLMESGPPVDRDVHRLRPVPGDPFTARASSVSECAFRSRCPFADVRCSEEAPRLTQLEDQHSVACFFPLQETKAAG